MNSDPDHIRLMESVALHFLGQLNENQSNRDRTQLRFGTNGSISVDLTKGVWFDHENNEGGGAIDLIMRETGLRGAREAYEWAEQEGYWTNGKTSFGKIIATYDYTDEKNVLLFQVVRLEPKTFRQRRPAKVDDNPKDIKNGWVWKAGKRRVPYCLPRVIEANGKHVIYICEGEKDCNNLIRLGLIATTNPGGASKGHGKWQDELTPHFRGADVVIIADNDEPGRSHAADIAAKLTGSAKRIRLLDIVSVWTECPLKGDISDWLDAGHSAEELGAIVAQLPDWRIQSASIRLGVLNAGGDVSLPPPRAWLLGNVFARNFLSSLFGDGGVGKTAVRYVQYMSLATGRTLAGDHVFQRCRVLIVSLEDDLADEHGNPKLGELSTNLESLIIEHKLDFIGLDPFIKTHGVGENNNNAVDLVAGVLIDLMFKHNISVDAPHHVSKPGAKGEAEPGDANRGRGASSLKDAARLIYTLNVMSKDEAGTLGIAEAERFAYVRMDKGKVNIVPPSRKAVWFHLVGVSLGNENEMYKSGDEVQAVESWFPPDMWKDLSDEQIDRILAEIDKGLEDGSRYSDAPTAKTRAAWKVVVKHVPKKTEQQAREIIRKWVEVKVLLSEDYHNSQTRKSELGLKENKDRPKGEEIPF
jgi:AAA domain